jgi:DNA-binding response OmpR family regulator
MKRARVLIVDDDGTAVSNLRLFVEASGFEAFVAYDGDSALELARRENPEVILLDVMLPTLNGFEVCRRLREFSDAAILFVTAKTFEQDRLRGLEGGADDYIVKPYSSREVVARMRAILRRTKPQPQFREALFTVGNLTIDRRHRVVSAGDRKLALTPTQFRLLTCLAEQLGNPISRKELIERVLGSDYEGLERTIDAHVASVRKRLRGAKSGVILKTSFGFGYRLDAETP